MVKVHKINPQTVTKEINKTKKSSNLKKDKKKAVSASNVTVKNEKLKLIREEIVSKKDSDSVDKKKKKKANANVELVQDVEQLVQKINKKDKKKHAESKKAPAAKEDITPELKQKKKKNKLKLNEDQKTANPAEEQEPKVQNGNKKNKKKQAINLEKVKKVKPTEESELKVQNGNKKNKKKEAIRPEKVKNVKPTEESELKVQNGNKKNKKEGKKQKEIGPAKFKKEKETKVEGETSTQTNKKKKQKAGQKEKKPFQPKTIIEAVPFDDEHFNAVVNLKNIRKISKALKTVVEKEVKETKKSIFEDYKYLLNICCFKIANCPKRMVKLNLAHPLVDITQDDVVIIVPDLQRGAKVDYEPTIQHYEDLFRECGITGLKIIPFNQLRQECTTFEAKRKFANTYDHFLCDGRIVGHVVGFCGAIFQKTRTTFHAVGLNDKKTYKRDIEKALKRTAFKQLKKGDLTTIPVGTHRFTTDQVADNIKLIVDQLKTLYPGGLGNIRNMHIKIDIIGTTALPLYVSLAAAPTETPSVIGVREQRLLKLKREANEVLTQFNMSKTGEFVKLDKAQAERKRKIMETRKALAAESLADNVLGKHDEEDPVPAKKSKKTKREKVLGAKKEKLEDNVEEDEEEIEDDTHVFESNENVDYEENEGDDASDVDDDDEDEDDDEDQDDDDDDEGSDDE